MPKNKPQVAPKPDIVRLAEDINKCEAALDRNVTQTVERQMAVTRAQQRVAESKAEEQEIRRRLAGLHREMDKHTSSTRLR